MKKMNRWSKLQFFCLVSCWLLPGTGVGQTAPGRQVYIGLRAESAGTAEARAVGIESPTGVAVLTVIADGPAAKAGLQRGDLIVAFGGKEINNFNDLNVAVQRSPIGSKRRVVFVRKNRRYHTDLVIGSRETGAGGAKPGGTPPTPKPGGASPASKPVAATMLQSLQFRAAAAKDFAKAMEQYRTGKAMSFLNQRENPLTKPRSVAWSTFFSNSLALMGHVDGPEPVVAFYNPLYDAVWITRWADRGNGPEMTAADLRVASAWASGGGGDPPPYATWLQGAAKRPAPEVIADQYVRFLKAFEKAFPTKATSIARIAASQGIEKTAAFVEKQAIDAIGNVIRIQLIGGPRYIGQIKELREALVRHDKEALARLVPAGSPTSHAALAELPAEFSRHLTPCYAVLGEKDSMVFLQDTLLPRCYLLIFFQHGATAGETKIRSVFFFQLAQDVRGGEA